MRWTGIRVKIGQVAASFFFCGVIAGVISALPYLISTLSAEGESSATEAVKGTITDLVQVLDDDTLKQPELAEERRHEIEEVIKHRVDYEEMAKRALGTSWSSLPHPDQREFVDLFVQLLRDTFVGRISEYSDEQVVYMSELRDDTYAEVKTPLKDGRTIRRATFISSNAQTNGGFTMW